MPPHLIPTLRRGGATRLRATFRCVLSGATTTCLLAAAACQQQVPTAAAEVATHLARHAPIRGVTISTHGVGRDWGSDAFAATLDELETLGTNWVAIHPYARISDSGAVTFRAVDQDSMITRPIREAHARGMKVLIKPHLAYWGSGFSWRGEITFESEAAWERFWESYRVWILEIAKTAEGADMFAVGTELDRTLEHETQWRELIATVRQQTTSPLMYAANWTDYQRVGFWDALDLIGIQGYFPICENAADERDREKAATGETPTDAHLRAGWRDLSARLKTFADAQDRDIVFAELGYNRSFDAARTPWEHHTDGAEAEPLQARCMAMALEAIAAEPRLRGAFLWKWFPGDRPNGRNFQLSTPRMRATIRTAWSEDRNR